jgi:hypothetical protein
MEDKNKNLLNKIRINHGKVPTHQHNTAESKVLFVHAMKAYLGGGAYKLTMGPRTSLDALEKGHFVPPTMNQMIIP